MKRRVRLSQTTATLLFEVLKIWSTNTNPTSKPWSIAIWTRDLQFLGQRGLITRWTRFKYLELCRPQITSSSLFSKRRVATIQEIWLCRIKTIHCKKRMFSSFSSMRTKLSRRQCFQIIFWKFQLICKVFSSTTYATLSLIATCTFGNRSHHQTRA